MIHIENQFLVFLREAVLHRFYCTVTKVNCTGCIVLLQNSKTMYIENLWFIYYVWYHLTNITMKQKLKWRIVKSETMTNYKASLLYTVSPNVCYICSSHQDQCIQELIHIIGLTVYLAWQPSKVLRMKSKDYTYNRLDCVSSMPSKQSTPNEKQRLYI